MNSLELSAKEFKILHDIMEKVGTDNKIDFKDEDSVHSLCAKVSAPFVPKDENTELIENVFGVTEKDDIFSDLYRAMNE